VCMGCLWAHWQALRITQGDIINCPSQLDAPALLEFRCGLPNLTDAISKLQKSVGGCSDRPPNFVSKLGMDVVLLANLDP
jgi:hypothetical protein